MSFDGKAVVITGGSSGIGLATARRVASEGGRVLITGTNAEKLAAARTDNIHILVNDAGDLAAADNLAAEAKRLFGKVDCAFLNAGVGKSSPLGSITPELFRQVMDLNVGGVLLGIQALVPLMGEGGSILVTSSSAKDRGFPGASLYSASKGALLALVKAIACELAPRRIRANLLSPGPIDSLFYERLGVPKEHLEMIERHHIDTHPWGRMGSVDEAAAVAAFLISDAASYVTGSDYAVDGGLAQF